MLLLAVSALEKMQTIKPDVWLKIGIAVAVFVIAVLVFQRVMKMNKIIGGVVFFVAFTVVFFSWVYNRSEPKFMTPIIDKVAPFFPSAGSYTTKQKVTPRN